MESNNILAAPQIVGADAFFEEWRRNHAGSLKDFYEFMTTPGTDRDRFMLEMEAIAEFAGSVVTMTLKK